MFFKGLEGVATNLSNVGEISSKMFPRLEKSRCDFPILGKPGVGQMMNYLIISHFGRVLRLSSNYWKKNFASGRVCG
jgi:hypothetical protein